VLVAHNAQYKHLPARRLYHVVSNTFIGFQKIEKNPFLPACLENQFDQCVLGFCATDTNSNGTGIKFPWKKGEWRGQGWLNWILTPFKFYWHTLLLSILKINISSSTTTFELLFLESQE